MLSFLRHKIRKIPEFSHFLPEYREGRTDIHLLFLKKIQGTALAAELQKACALYKKGGYHQALELDRVLPRLKHAYQKALFAISRETKTPLINIQDSILQCDNGNFFVDYCHPLPCLNRMIAAEIINIRNRDILCKPVMRRIKDSLFASAHQKHSHLTTTGVPPPDIYTMY